MFFVFLLISVFQAAALKMNIALDFVKTNSRPAMYYVSTAVGSPSQQVSLLFDLGSSYTRVDDAECADCSASRRFTRADSKSFVYKSSVTFGAAAAVLGEDFVWMGGYRMRNQTVAVMQQKSERIYRGFDGLLVNSSQGLAFGDSLNLIETLKREGAVENATFAVYLSRSASSDLGSVLHFNTYDLRKYSTETAFKFASVEIGRKWKFNLTNPQIGIYPLDNAPRVAVLESINSDTFLPGTVFRILKRRICERVACSNGDETLLNCDEIANLENITFELGGVNIQLEPDDYVDEDKNGNCKLMFKSNTKRIDWAFGTFFMQKYYMLFDSEQKRVGFAPAKQKENKRFIKVVLIIELIIAVLILCTLIIICCCTSSKSNYMLMEDNYSSAGDYGGYSGGDAGGGDSGGGDAGGGD